MESSKKSQRHKNKVKQAIQKRKLRRQRVSSRFAKTYLVTLT